MPTPRASTGLRTQAQRSKLVQGVVITTQGLSGRRFGVFVDGQEIGADATIDAPIQIGDVVWVTQSPSGWLLTGVA